MARPTCPTHVALVLALVLLAPIGLAATAETTGKLELPPASDGTVNGLVGAAAIYHDGATYVFGGRMKEGATFSEAIYRYDHATGATELVTTFPPVQSGVHPGRYEGGLAMLGGKMYYFGGAAQIPVILPGGTEPRPVPTSIKDIIEFDPLTKRARKLSVELPYSAWGLAAATYGPRIYLFGGFSFNIPTNEFGRHSEIIVFSPTEGLGGTPIVRTLSATLPLEVQDAAPALVNNRVYLFGGLADHTNETDANKCPVQSYRDPETGEQEEAQVRACETDAIIAFDPEQERVLGVTARLPYKPQWAAAAAVRGKAYVMGGKISSGAASSSIIEFNPANVAAPTRILTPTLPQGLIAPAASTDGQLIYLFGGRGENVFSATPDVVTVNPGVTPPWAPRSPAAQKSGNEIRVSWEPPAYNGESAVTAYRLYRSTGGNETFLGELTELSFVDRDVEPNVEYVYRITAVNSAGESRTSARATLTSEAVVPSAVNAFEAFPGNKEVLLRWGPPSSTGGSNLTGYRIYKNESDLPVQSLPPGVLEWKDTAVENGVAYRYQVAAVNAKGEGARTPARLATPVAVPPAPYLAAVMPDATGVLVAWEPPAETLVRSFMVLRGTDPARLLPIANLTAEEKSYLDVAAQRGRTYYYSVAASNDVGTSPPSNVASISLVSKPAAPQNLLAAPGAGEIRLTWQPPQDTGEADPAALTYYVTRDGRIIATDIKGVTYVDRTTLPGRNYTYTVTTFNGIESDPSESVRAASRPVVNEPPTAVVAVLTSIILPGDLAEVDGSQSSDPDGSIAKYLFDFGDHSPVVESSTATVTHTYEENKTYTITLRVVDNRGTESAPATATIQVGQPLRAEQPSDEPGLVSTTTPTGERPGTTNPKIPGPGLLPVLALVAVAALLLRRRR